MGTVACNISQALDKMSSRRGGFFTLNASEKFSRKDNCKGFIPKPPDVTV